MPFKFKGLRKRIVAFGTATVLTVGAVCGAFYFGGIEAEAKVTLRGIETLVDKHSADINAKSPDPFVVLEVVPSLDRSELGYLVGGEEPIDERGNSIKDMPSRAERVTKLGNYKPYEKFTEQDLFGRLVKKDALRWNDYKEFENKDDKLRLCNIRGFFYSNTGKGRYEANDFSEAYEKKYGLEAGLLDVTTIYGNKNLKGDVLYRRTNAYRKIDDFYTGSYSFSIRKIKDDASEMPIESESGIYNFQYFKATKVKDTDEFKEGQYIYTCANGASGEALDYYGEVVKVEEGGKSVLKIRLKDMSFTEVKDLNAEGEEGETPTPSATPEEGEEGVSPTPTQTPEEGVSPTPTETPEGGEEGVSPTPTETPEGGEEGVSPTPTETPEGGEEGVSPTPTETPEEGDAGATATPEATPSEPPTENPTETPSPVDGANDNETEGINIAKNTGFSSIDAIYGSTAVLGAIRDEVYDYYIVSETNSADVGCYRIDVIEAGSGPFGVKYGYSKVLGDSYNSTNCAASKGPYYVKTDDQDDYIYIETEDDEYDFHSDYSKDIYQSFYYTGGYTNSEWFKQYVLDREPGTECDNLYVDVMPITIDMLPDYIDMANLVYFSGDRYPEDIDEDVAMKILTKVANDDFPVILEKSTYYANLHLNVGESQEEMDERVNLTLLYLELVQSTIVPVIEDAEDMPADRKAITKADWKATAKEFSEKIVAEVITPGLSEAEKNNRSEKRSNLLKNMFYPYDTKASDTSFVHGTIFLNDDWDENWDNGAGYPKGKVVSTGRVVSDDFITPYTDAKLAAIEGFQEMLDEYESERAIIEAYGNWDNFNHTVSKATCIRYILNANNNRNSVKSKLNILDIEPYESAQYTDKELLTDMYMNAYGSKLWTARDFERRDNLERDWVYSNIIGVTTQSEKEKYTVDIKQMGTKELIGRNDDLNATYDMIYIGMDTAIMNTDNNDWWGYELKRTAPVFNFSQQNHLVYSHLGEPFHNEQYATATGDFNTSGNDITFDKLRELTEYIQAGYAVLISDDFFNIDEKGYVTGINEDKLDISSNMYKLIKNVVLLKDEGAEGDEGDQAADAPVDENKRGYKYFGKNVFRRGALESKTAGNVAARETFGRYINISKLDIEVIKKPIAYNGAGDNGPYYLEKNPDGSYSLDFEVSLTNDSAVDATNSTYDCKLYLDLDADGKFEEGEAMPGLLINGGAEGMNDGVFNLRTGNTYTISRTTPEDYIGFLAWKLAFILNENENNAKEITGSVRSAITGFSAVPAESELDKPTIKILQITPNVGTVNNLDLTQLQYLYDQVKDFSINITQVQATEYIHKTRTELKADKLSYYDFLCQFDMVVIGFTDCFNLASVSKNTDVGVYVPVKDADGNVTSEIQTKNKQLVQKEAILGIREYALSGRSILFTHDLTSQTRNRNYTGYESTMYLRDIMGMDRFGQLKADGIDNEQYAYDSTNMLKTYQSVYDTPVVRGVTTDNIGFTDANLMRFRLPGAVYGITTRQATTSYDVSSYAYKDGKHFETVTAINEGQITQYPFHITDGVGGDSNASTFEASMTHAQYYQLNLDTDSRDENTNDDVVVWYAISNNHNSTNDPLDSSKRGGLHEYYKALHNDVRNNYYIYSKGNVMYTGAGHSTVNSEEERKLFVNTLVASYNSGLHSPHVVYKENPWETAATVNSIHLPYDAEIYMNEADENASGNWLDTTVDINFKTINNNFKGSKNNLLTRYFVTVADPSAATLIYNGVYLKEITPVKFSEVINGEKTDADPYNLTNYRLYQATFNLSDLNMGSGLLVKDVGTIYIQIGTEELSSGNVESLTATESLLENKLSLYTAKLFDLE